MAYPQRIALASMLLALLTGLVIIIEPRQSEVVVVAQTPTGDQIPAGTSIRVTFSRPVDQPSAEAHFSVVPATPGRFTWTEQTLIFQPHRPLLSETSYEVVIQPGLRDAQGYATTSEIKWTFRTRPAQLLLAEPNAFFLANADGSNARQIATREEAIGRFSVSPDGSEAAYSVIHDYQRSSLHLLNLIDGTSRPLAESPDFSAENPAWAPFGDFIAFERSTLIGDAVGPPHIWLAQPDGTSLGPILTGDEQDISFSASWAPDGSRLSFTDGLSQTLSLFTFSGTRTTLPSSAGEPASWAPDSRSLLYSSYESTTVAPKPVIRQVQIGSSGEPSTISAPPEGASGPAWSPDGQWIAYIQYDAQQRGAVWIMEADGSRPRQLTTPGDADDQQIVWSSDSRSITFLRFTEGGMRSDAWIVPHTGGTASLLRENVVQVAWVP